MLLVVLDEAAEMFFDVVGVGGKSDADVVVSSVWSSPLLFVARSPVCESASPFSAAELAAASISRYFRRRFRARRPSLVRRPPEVLEDDGGGGGSVAPSFVSFGTGTKSVMLLLM